MASTLCPDDLQVFLGYFEEPEPGVPDGCTGWYHSSGQFEVRTAEQIFDFEQNSRTMVRDNVSGPFTCQQEALEHLQACLS